MTSNLTDRFLKLKPNFLDKPLTFIKKIIRRISKIARIDIKTNKT